MSARDLKMPEPPLPYSETGGVQPMTIAGRMISQRERCIGMTDEERAWRAKWLKDQILSKNEPCVAPEYYRLAFNPIRRLSHMPLNVVFGALEPALGKHTGLARFMTSKLLAAAFGICTAWYYFKYNSYTWEMNKGWRIITSSMRYLPGDGDPKDFYVDKTASEYASYGFEKSPI